MRTSNPPAGRVDPVSRWLVISRASVLPMTLTAAAIAGLLAAFHDEQRAVGLVRAGGGRVGARPRRQQPDERPLRPRGRRRLRQLPACALRAAPGAVRDDQPSRGCSTAAIAVNAADLAILVVLVVARGWPMVAFALGGFLLSVAYTAPPLRLKKHGLGEPTVLVVWGPLMVGGAYYAAAGHLPCGIVAGVGAVRAAVHRGAHGQAHRQDPVGRARRHPHAAGDARRARGRVHSRRG